LDYSSLYYNWFPSLKEEVKGLMSWLRCFLIFFLEWLLDHKFVDIVSLNNGSKENYIKSLCNIWVSSPSGSPLEGSIYGVDERSHLMPHACERQSFIIGDCLFVGETFPHDCERYILVPSKEIISL
jgi:hypothetical protein